MQKDAKIITMIIMVVLCTIVGVVFYYQSLAGRPSHIVIPAGGTYLGPNAPK